MSYISEVLGGTEVRYPGDVARIQRVAMAHGFVLTPMQAEQVWDLYSDSMAAGWMGLPESDEELWEIIG